ncbi:hypothetical protein ACK3Y0_09620 [Aeromonas caviae]|uniref:hypothetical protein n=1 Tax=Aeromonas caviae TaxID=648 RepID=UPI002B47F468|nr:hypothetical protein [Aeromonas caviae]
MIDINSKQTEKYATLKDASYIHKFIIQLKLKRPSMMTIVLLSFFITAVLEVLIAVLLRGQPVQLYNFP